MSRLNTVDVPGPRFIDPKAPLVQQVAMLLELIKSPPENSRVVTWTPELAEWVIENRNTKNRKRRPMRIKRYASMMADGPAGWVLSGDTVKFGRSGRLIDGQNRLAACFNAQRTFRTHVVFGIDDEAFDVIDSGKTRTAGDTLYTAGVQHSEIVTPAVRWITILGSDNPTDRGRSIANQDMLRLYKELDRERLDRAVQWAIDAHKIVPRGNLAACLYLFDQKNPKEAKRFANDIVKGQRAGLKLRNKFISLHKDTLGRVHENQRNAIIIQAWNAFRSGGAVTAQHLRYSEKEFPAIAG